MQRFFLDFAVSDRLCLRYLKKKDPVGDNLLEMRIHPLLAIVALLAGPFRLLTPAVESKAAPAVESAKDGGAVPKPAAAQSRKDTLDRAKVHAEYGDGNFENVIRLLEDFRTQHKDFRRVDSFFVAKYLGVVYASNPATREKGKYWLYRMLQIEPGADVVDMYVGEAVDKTFEKVRQEFIVRRNYRGINDVKLAKAVQEGERTHDTLVVRDTIRMGEVYGDSLPERRLKDFRHGWTGNLNLGVGLKLMDKTDWGATRKQKEFRMAFDIRQRRWPINIAADFMYSMSEEDYVQLEDETIAGYRQSSYELNAGVRKIFDNKLYSMRPFVGGGFGYISTALTTFKFQQGTIGAWAEGGIYWELERHFNIGAEMLWSWAEIPYGIQQVTNAGGLHFEMILGYHW